MLGKNTFTKIVIFSAHFLYSGSLFSTGYSWAVATTGQCLFRSSIDASSPWAVASNTGLPLTYIGVAYNGQAWALTAPSVPPATPVANVWYRTGITATNLQGTGWIGVSGILATLSVGYNGELVGTDALGDAYFLMGSSVIAGAAPVWTGLGSGFSQIVIGPNGIIWAIKPNGTVWVRTGITATVPQGAGWLQVTGTLTNISIGMNGVVYGVNSAINGTYMRAGVTSSTPAGTSWQTLSTTPAMTTISASQNTSAVWAIDTTGKYYSWSGSAWTQITN